MRRWHQDHRPTIDQQIATMKERVIKLTSRGAAKTQVERIEQAVNRRDAAELAIANGFYAVCNNRLCPDRGDFKNHRFLCDQWSGKTGASVARAGAAADKLPGELMEIHGDGTEGLK